MSKNLIVGPDGREWEGRGHRPASLDGWLDMHGVAEKAGLSHDTIRWHSKQGTMPAGVMFGRTKWFREEDIDVWLAHRLKSGQHPVKRPADTSGHDTRRGNMG